MKRKFIVVSNDGYGFQGIMHAEDFEEEHYEYIPHNEYRQLFGMEFDTILDYDSNTDIEDTLEMLKEELPEYEFKKELITR
jgi:hypothetical protein